MDDGLDMKEGHVKESNEVMGVLSSKFEAALAGIVGVTNPDITHNHVERRGLKKAGTPCASVSGLCPSKDVVTCVDGYATSVGSVTYDAGTVTCQDACDRGCCLGNGMAYRYDYSLGVGQYYVDVLDSTARFVKMGSAVVITVLKVVV